ncbi:MAG: tRNA (adenosine(37)-N6)-threonylcarbamoyltransferase complex dimerization subunit type 1 TsaB [Ferruginibacter sp.]
MSIILNIDTAAEKAHVSFAKNGQILHALNSGSQKEHASFLQTAIQELIKITGIVLKDINAVAVTSGPGSYTGLRVGMASAKGLCYALKKPLITIGSLEVLTVSALQLFPETPEAVLFCPMIDARRMEVFTAIYQKDLTEFHPPSAMILDEFSFEKELDLKKMMFFGSGADKWKLVCKHTNAVFETVSILPESMSKCSDILFSENKFTELAYSQPLYVKEFQTVIKSQE